MRTEKSGWTAALLILQIAVGAMLAVGGIWALQDDGDFAARAIKGLVSGNVENILVIVFGVIELLVGVFMILKIVIGDRFGSFGTVLALIAIVVWIVAIVLSDILISKCKCGPVELPVVPTSAISCPWLIWSPCLTYKLLQCA